MSWNDEYRDKMRAFMERRGQAVQFSLDYRGRLTDYPSTFGWEDTGAQRHIIGPYRPDEPMEPTCRWVIRPGALLTEQTYSQFEDTFTGNRDEVGVNVGPADCACGLFTDRTLRYTGTIASVLAELFGPARTDQGIRL